MKTSGKPSIPSPSSRRRKKPFKRFLGRGSRWLITALCLFFGVPLVLSCLPVRINTGPVALGLMFVNMLSFFPIVIYAAYLTAKDRAAFIAATLNAPEEKDTLNYISAFFHDADKVQAQVAPVVSELLGRLSADELAYIPEVYWNRLCPIPDDTYSGYSKEKNVDLYDQVHAAAFSAIMRLKRMESLPRIEMWMNRLKTNRHSGEFIRSLHECYETLLEHQASIQESSSLLRSSSAEAAITDVLLRPVSGTYRSETETGEQLLRSSTGEDPFASDQNKPFLPAE